MAKNVIEVSENTFEAEVLKSDIPVLADFWAPWCGPCRMVTPVVEELSTEMSGKVKFVKINVDDNQGIAAKYSVMAIPTILLFKNGQVLSQQVGALNKPTLKAFIEKAI